MANTQKNLTKKYLSLVFTRDEQYFYFFFKYPSDYVWVIQN